MLQAIAILRSRHTLDILGTKLELGLKMFQGRKNNFATLLNYMKLLAVIEVTLSLEMLVAYSLHLR